MTDGDARDYVAHSGAQQVWARELIAKLRLRGKDGVIHVRMVRLEVEATTA